METGKIVVDRYLSQLRGLESPSIRMKGVVLDVGSSSRGESWLLHTLANGKMYRLRQKLTAPPEDAFSTRWHAIASNVHRICRIAVRKTN
eukprot:CAMPEP_0174383470 /NCGR_PEP_ID=MMETSP0811_2-20130205/125259_1 /TAXON_ID=73025 ORGANISM="Eutreptiella gymnastica-like, Strain CCMP1594" /NCGR_SAMPLE_ID=MMETSP0811_2 /ASSEMBLY_ACC=CAM_ASM_000667 /LENGTH=89 /DNA_ID=CAMNT_0015537073 /DNA_START=1534 /DNA_END=1803 /DNA_ORIENTATION=+